MGTTATEFVHTSTTNVGGTMNTTSQSKVSGGMTGAQGMSGGYGAGVSGMQVGSSGMRQTGGSSGMQVTSSGMQVTSSGMGGGMSGGMSSSSYQKTTTMTKQGQAYGQKR